MKLVPILIENWSLKVPFLLKMVCKSFFFRWLGAGSAVKRLHDNMV